jgi:two-component system, NtrC family, sensor kinase
MNKLLLWLLLFFGFQAFAQDNLPEAFTVSQDSVKYSPMPLKYWQYYYTGKDSVSFSRVTTSEFSTKFITFKQKDTDAVLKVNIGNVSKNVWLRFRLKNIHAEPLQVALAVKSRRGTYYIGHDGKWQDFTTGYLVPWSKKSGIKRFNYIVYTLPANTEVTVYAHLNNLSGPDLDMAPEVVNYATFVKSVFHDQTVHDFEDIISAAFFGFILFAVLFNLLFFYVNRERVYLVYSVTLLIAAFTTVSGVIDSTFFKENPGGGSTFQSALIFILMFMIIHTVRLFFRIRQHYPRWDTALVWSPVIVLLLAVVCAILPATKFKDTAIISVAVAAVILMLVFFVGTIIMVIAFLRKKNKEALLFVVAALPFFLSILISMFDFDWAIPIGSIWTISVLSWGMFARFKGLQIENARVALEQEEERSRLIAQQNEILEQQVAERTAALQQSLENLKQTQNQLIQSEKMASLGELTAGIAHEIQNPLNFVNNFSDVSVELLEELDEEAKAGNTEDVLAISSDLKLNLEKIAHHGRRADNIVKGMLQHSRASTGQKEPTDINVLADEYLRLAYHGLRAKDKSFNADLVTNFAEGLPRVNIIPQDIGRVLLNLFTNAFYATQEKGKQSQSQLAGYKPVVTVSTKQVGDAIEITVKDNGTGIPDAIKDKILQPFFTTKPTGEGTGLGLSLSYDIVVKGHGGSIDIKSVDGEGSEFIITLPS